MFHFVCYNYSVSKFCTTTYERTAALAGIAFCQESSGSGLTASTKRSHGQESSVRVNLLTKEFMV